MTLASEVEEIVLDTLRDRFGLYLPDRFSCEERCGCGLSHEQNRDIYGKPNGYKTHDLATCLTHLRDRIIQLEGRLKELEQQR